jgi:hypothetical protein
MSGDFFLAIFSGLRGSALRQLFAVEDSFIGRVISRAPNTVKSASLSLA